MVVGRDDTDSGDSTNRLSTKDECGVETIDAADL
jgi:hypothetical protein